MRVDLVLDARNVVGESAVWSVAEQALYWVDIVGSHIHRFDPWTRRHHSWPTPDLPTSIGLRRDGGFIVGLRRRVVLWVPGGIFEDLATPEPDHPDNRLNEGVVAPDGTFWVGTMQDNIAADGSPKPMTADRGAIYRIRADGTVEQLTEQDFGITNTMIWPEGGGFITADTRKNALYRYDLSDGVLRNRRSFALLFERGVPDGSATDRTGAIFNARVGGGAIARLAPGGDLIDMIDLPCALPTSCAFGGANLSTLFVTSARFGLTVDADPVEGGLFALEMETPGLPPNLFG